MDPGANRSLGCLSGFSCPRKPTESVAKCAVASFQRMEDIFEPPKKGIDVADAVFPEGQIVFRPNALDLGFPMPPSPLRQKAVVIVDASTVSKRPPPMPDSSTTNAIEDQPSLPVRNPVDKVEVVAPAANQVSIPFPPVDPEVAARQQEWANAVLLPCGSGQTERRWADGRVYRGEWHVQGWPHGEGQLRCIGDGGGVYRGQWVDGKLHGSGEFVASVGGSYRGQWALGVPHGAGAEIWKDGTCYQGTFQHGRAHGTGTIKLPSGMIRRVM
eukprot:TRINITY_DN28626_c0_g1_i1.p1 TRINITY_DN28626_c0_g1~~TRINITY_DN28626_c0_g1_i1.p1  ORF type:complete len:295 (+),score=25.93 TRINITY_DN28626_c0_g1_i1:75-887(+)